jgi:hypothetical protein
MYVPDSGPDGCVDMFWLGYQRQVEDFNIEAVKHADRE